MAVTSNFATQLARRAGHASEDAASIISDISDEMVDLITVVDAALPPALAVRMTPLIESRLYDLMGEIASEFTDFVAE